MSLWLCTLKLKDIFHDETKSFEQRRDVIAARIKTAAFYDENDFELVDMVDQLEFAETAEAFNDYWAEFYNWADDNRVWVETV